jgi:hypothetical protein
MMRKSSFAVAGLLGLGLGATPAFADCASEIRAFSRINDHMSSATAQEYQAAQAANAQRKEDECMRHIREAESLHRSSGRSNRYSRSDRRYSDEEARLDAEQRRIDEERAQLRERNRSSGSSPGSVLDQLLGGRSR